MAEAVADALSVLVSVAVVMGDRDAEGIGEIVAVADREGTGDCEVVPSAEMLTVCVDDAVRDADTDTVVEREDVKEKEALSAFVAVRRRQFRPPYRFGHTH